MLPLEKMSTVPSYMLVGNAHVFKIFRKQKKKSRHFLGSLFILLYVEKYYV